MEKKRRIDWHLGDSIEQLEWIPGDLILFDTNSSDFSQPALLGIVESLAPAHGDFDCVRLRYAAKGKEPEDWSLFPKSNVLALLSPRKMPRVIVPNVSTLWPNIHDHSNVYPHSTTNLSYFFETACTGMGEIDRYLRELCPAQGMDFYADCLKNGRLGLENNGKPALRFSSCVYLK